MENTHCNKNSKVPSDDVLSRRDFARITALVTAAALVPSTAEAQTQAAPSNQTPSAAPVTPNLSPAAQAEAEAKIQNIIRKYGDRLTEEQRSDIRKSVMQNQDALEKLRAFPLENSDEPALALRVTTGQEL